MKTTTLRRLMHLVLAAAATDAAFACGGAIAPADESDDPSGTGSGTASSSGGGMTTPETTERTPKTRPDGGVRDAAIDASRDAAPDARRDASFDQCHTGHLAPDPALCCAPNQPGCSGQGGGDEPCALDCQAVCDSVASGSTSFGCHWTMNNGAQEISYYCGACGIGRIPDGLGGCARGDSVGERLAMQAYYEEASVIAFERLADVLEADGAPTELVERARRAATDERRHARTFRRLARTRGAVVRRARADDRRPTLLDLAIENAREGCVRETYGALVALHQAEHAEDAELRAAFAGIAGDEIAHAALSWELAAWFESRLGAAPLRGAYDEAREELRHLATRDHDSADAALGIPRPDKGRTMFDDLFARVAHAA